MNLPELRKQKHVFVRTKHQKVPKRNLDENYNSRKRWLFVSAPWTLQCNPAVFLQEGSGHHFFTGLLQTISKLILQTI
ncbi:hypothetical protein ACSBR1_027510 [Camellia fascicularis]